MPLSASELKMRRLTPTTPTMDRPVTVMSVVSLMDDMPLIGFPLFSMCDLMTVPFLSG